LCVAGYWLLVCLKNFLFVLKNKIAAFKAEATYFCCRFQQK